MAGAMAVLILIGAVGVWWGTRGVPLTRSETAGGRLFEQLAVVLRNRDARMLILTFVLQAVAIGMVLGGVVYVARHVTNDPGIATLAFVCFVAPAVVLTPAWSALARRIGKRRGFAVATVVETMGFIGLLGARSGEAVPLLVAAGIVGIGYAGGQLFPLAMLPDLAADDAKRSGTNRIGMISGVWSGFELLGYALGPALLGLALSVGGYVASTGDGVAQSGTAQWAIVLGVSVIPAVLCAISLIPLSRYRLDDAMRAAA
jgi:Na+/melibiose symporter-like transporter